MSKLVWKVYNTTRSIDLSSYVQSVSISWGRDSPITPYQGRTAIVTILNDALQSANVKNADAIELSLTVGTYTNVVMLGIVQTKDFQDQPGTGAGSTMSFVVVDNFVLSGFIQFDGTVTSALFQIDELASKVNTTNLGPWYFGGYTTASMSIGTISTNVQARLNQIILADRGFINKWCGFGIGYTNYLTPQLFSSTYVKSTPVFGRTATSTQIGYQTIDRKEAASSDLFYNQATVTGASATVTSNNANLYYYGIRSFTTTTPQADLVTGTSQWFANAYSDPENISLEVGFTDIAQVEAALKLFLQNCVEGLHFVPVSYTPPGGTTTTGYFMPEKITINSNTSSSSVVMTMTSINYYYAFELDSSTFGILDTSRLGVGPI